MDTYIYLWWSFFCSVKDEIYINVSEYFTHCKNNGKKNELMNGVHERGINVCMCGYYIIITLNLYVVFIFFNKRTRTTKKIVIHMRMLM